MNKVTKIENNYIMSKFQKTENILNDVKNIIEVSQHEAYRTVNTILSQRNWLIGHRIAEEELAGENRAEYGANIIKKLSKNLTEKGIRKRIYTVFIAFTNTFLIFSTRRVENLLYDYHGHIIELCCKYMMKRRANGMRRKHMNRLGVCVLYSGI